MRLMGKEYEKELLNKGNGPILSSIARI
jgi:hypothetical protein